jgi:hypothetical protein
MKNAEWGDEEWGMKNAPIPPEAAPSSLHSAFFIHHSSLAKRHLPFPLY